jgi:hypothetical protein
VLVIDKPDEELKEYVRVKQEDLLEKLKAKRQGALNIPICIEKELN